MSELTIKMLEKERCTIIDQHSGTEICTEAPVEWGGKGRTLSPTDLVAAALGSCLLTILESVFERNGYDPKKIEIKVAKELMDKPFAIKSLSAGISYPDELEASFKQKALTILEMCPVKNAIHPNVETSVNFE